MSGKENTGEEAGIGSPHNDGGPASNEVMSGTATPHSRDDSARNENDELFVVTENLNQIEAILKAESKRRIEANKLNEEYILDYLEKMEQELNNRVSKQFQAMEKRIMGVDNTLSKIEN